MNSQTPGSGRRLGRGSVLLMVGAFVAVQVPRIANSVNQTAAGVPPAASVQPAPLVSSGASTTPPVAESARLLLTNGETVWVNRVCAWRQQTRAKHRAAEDAAVTVAQRRKALRVSRLRFERFLRAHPQRQLPADLFHTYTRLHRQYRAALLAHNRAIVTFNQAADSYNRTLLACKTHG